MKATLLLAAVILYGGCSATPTEVSNTKKPSQSGESQFSAVTSNAQATATSSSLPKTSSKTSASASSASASVTNSVQGGNQESGSFDGGESRNSLGSKAVGIRDQGSGKLGRRGSISFQNQASSGTDGVGSISLGDQDSESDYIGKNISYGEFDADGEYEEEDDDDDDNEGFSNQEENGNYNDNEVNSQSNNNARGDIGGLSAALLLAHHANLAHLIHLSHHLNIPEIIGLNILTRGMPGGLMNLWPLHHLTNHKWKDLMYINALSKSLPNLVKSNPLGRGKAFALQSARLLMPGRGWNGQDIKRFQGKRLNY